MEQLTRLLPFLTLFTFFENISPSFTFPIILSSHFSFAICTFSLYYTPDLSLPWFAYTYLIKHSFSLPLYLLLHLSTHSFLNNLITSRSSATPFSNNFLYCVPKFSPLLCFSYPLLFSPFPLLTSLIFQFLPVFHFI